MKTLLRAPLLAAAAHFVLSFALPGYAALFAPLVPKPAVSLVLDLLGKHQLEDVPDAGIIVVAIGGAPMVGAIVFLVRLLLAPRAARG